MTKDIKYPEELNQAEIIKKLERLQAKLRHRARANRILKENDGDVLEDCKKEEKP